MPKRRVLIVTTSHAKLGKTGRRTGVWLEELAAPYYALREASSFTDAEEKALGLAEVVPFLLETHLRELGGRFEGGPRWQPFVVRDGNLITGQNPMSSTLLAERVIEVLEVQKVA
jgi:putative intracellular protease/amidase